MIVDSAVYRDGARVPVECGVADYATLREAASGDREFVWVGLHEPTNVEMEAVARAFGLHPLAVEDSLHAHQRPKLESYDDMVFLVLKTLWYVDAHDAVETGQVTLFVGKDYVVTVRQGAGTELHQARLDLEGKTAVLGHGPSAVVYAICDRVVDSYESVVDSVQTDVDEVEESVFSLNRAHDSRRIYTLKRELAEVRRAVNPLRDPMQRFVEGDVMHLAEEARPFFRDVLDHVVRVSEWVDGLDSLLGTAFQAHLAQISVQQNDDMRKISAWVSIGAVGTLIAGIYGMNFENMPELRWHYGYYLCLALMLVVSVALWRAFKRSGWL
jgi:magnesium transporter